MAHRFQCTCTIFHIKQIGVLPARCQYVRNLRSSQRYYKLQSHNGYILADCDHTGNLNRNYCLLQQVNYQSVSGNSFQLLKCLCTTAKQQRARLDVYPSELAEAESITAQEKDDYSFHAYTADILFEDGEEMESDKDTIEEQDEMTVDFLSLNPPLVAVFDGESYGLVGCKRTSKFQCLLCDHHCQHVRLFNDWCSANDVHLDKEEPVREEQSFTSVSSSPIPYPLPSHLRSLHDKHESGSLEFPLQLVPPYICSPADPTWISSKGAIIHKEAVTITDKACTIYYQPSLGSCDCKQQDDGPSRKAQDICGWLVLYAANDCRQSWQWKAHTFYKTAG